MPDTDPTPPVTPPAATPQPYGYFNKAQLEDLEQAEGILTAARANPEALAEQDITAGYVDGFAAHVAETRTRASEAGQGKLDAKAATELAGVGATALHTALQQIQSSAKQKHKMLAEDGDPTTNFSTAGYLIGTRLNGSRARLLQNAEALILRIKADSLPGFKTPEKIDAISLLLAAYRGNESDQQETTLEKEVSRLDRDQLIHVLNTRRSSIQHAADAIWP